MMNKKATAFDRKIAVEECYSLSLSRLLQEGYLKNHESTQKVPIRNHRGKQGLTLTIDMAPDEEESEWLIRNTLQSVVLRATTLHFGGKRWWFVCPECTRRCSYLYSMPGKLYFSCRQCLDLTYRSCQDSHSNSSINIPGVGRRVRYHWRRKRDRRSDYKGRGWRFHLTEAEKQGMVSEDSWRAHRVMKIFGEDDPYLRIPSSE